MARQVIVGKAFDQVYSSVILATDYVDHQYSWANFQWSSETPNRTGLWALVSDHFVVSPDLYDQSVAES